MQIRIIITGGTFDKEYNELTGELFFQNTHLPEMLSLGRNKVHTSISALMMIDSLLMNDEQRMLICTYCKDAAEDKIIITHGTDTMVETAIKIKEANLDKTIILTGAMVPYKFGSSDGLFNLGSAIAFAQVLPNGVYIAMNGKYFTAGNVRKNKTVGEFEELG